MVDEVTAVHILLGVGETKLFLLQSNEVGSRCWTTCLLGLCALLSTQSSHLASAPCQETSNPSLQGSSVKSRHSPVCWRNPQWVQNVNMPQLSTAAVFILWCMNSGSLTNSQGSVKGDKTSCQELSFTAQELVPPPLEKKSGYLQTEK